MCKKISVMLLILATLCALTACHRTQTVKGNGVRQTVNRDVEQFQSIQVNGNFDVVVVGQMPHTLALTADTNVQPFISTTVKNGTLIIEIEKNHQISTEQPPLLQVNLTQLKSMEISGSGRISATKMTGNELALKSSGEGRFNVSGTTGILKISLSGSSEVNAQDLLAKRADIDVSGTARVSVSASQELNVKVSGTGLVEYYGAPSKVTQDISGNGRIIGISANAQKNPS